MRMGSPKYTDAAKETIKSMRQYFHDLEILIRYLAMVYVPNPRERESHYRSKKRRSRPWRRSLREEQRR
jgi:hypothetical protein